jgi:acyl-CoA synthetase (NDP forming)
MMKKLDNSMFRPTSVAIAGISRSHNEGWGFIESLLASGFKGMIYPLNPKHEGGEILGFKVYSSIRDIPGSVDYVISCLPSHVTPHLIRECAAKGVRLVCIFAAGFSETGEKEGRGLEDELRQAAQGSNLRILGPNCVGLYCPELGISFASDFPKESGGVALISQSGGCAIQLIRDAGQRGVRFSKAISYGNSADINETDLLEYFIADDETDVVAAYIEGVRGGQRFGSVLKKLSATKPVVVVKAGCTGAGAVAAASHTGALTGGEQVWDALLKQAGAMRVFNIEELADMMVTFSYLTTPIGRRLAIACGGGGGTAVIASDQYASAGFVLPPLDERTGRDMRQEIRDLVGSDAGLSLRNPFDLQGLQSAEGLYAVIRRLAISQSYDLLATHFFGTGWPGISSPASVWPELFADAIIKVHVETKKTMAAAIWGTLSGVDGGRTPGLQRRCYEAGLPVYHSTDSAAKALGRFLHHCENHLQQRYKAEAL